MYLSKHRVGELSRSHIDSFGGYDHNIRIADNEFYDMKNLTSTYYPTLSPRDRRGAVKQISDCNGLLAKDKLAYVEGNTLHYGDFTMELKSYVTGERQLVSMGAYLIVFPDMLYVNTSDTAEYGECDEMVTSSDGETNVYICDEKGNKIKALYIKTPDGEKKGGAWEEYENYWKYSSSHSHGSASRTVDCILMLKGEKILWRAGYLDSRFFYIKTHGVGVDVKLDIWTESGYAFELTAKECGEYVFEIASRDASDTSDTVYHIHIKVISSESPESHEDFEEYLLDCTENEAKLCVCNETGKWSPITGYVYIDTLNKEINLEGDKKYFFELDTENEAAKLLKSAFAEKGETLKTKKMYSEDLSSESLLVECLLWGVEEITESMKIVVRRPHHIMDYLIESNNRLWGCRYGLNRDGEFVNEIYATALGEFGTWNKYDGTSQDSYTVSLGTDGAFTGAVNFRGQPMFFKENCCHTVYGYYPQSYQMLTDTGMGLQKGSGKSLCIIQNVLYYKALDGIYRYDGSSADRISDALGQTVYSEAVGGGIDSKYYVAMTAENGTRELFVLDITKGLWHKEDDAPVRYFARYGGDLWFWRADTQSLCTVKGTEGELEAEDIEWFAETGIIGYSTHDAKYVGNLQLRIMLPVGSSVQFYIEYDSDGYMELKGSIEGKSFRAFTIPIIPRRCDHFKIRITGTGPCRIYSFSKILEQGGEI